MPKEPSYIGMSEKECNKDNSQKPDKILLLLKKIMNKSESKPPKVKDNNKVDLYIIKIFTSII